MFIFNDALNTFLFYGYIASETQWNAGAIIHKIE